MHDERNLPVLHREVLPPPSTSSSWGLILVAATALSFALAGSLLMVRATAQVAHEREVILVGEPAPPATISAPREVRSIRLERAPRAITPPAECRGPVYHANGDGRAEATFELCPPHTGHVTRIVAD